MCANLNSVENFNSQSIASLGSPASSLRKTSQNQAEASVKEVAVRTLSQGENANESPSVSFQTSARASIHVIPESDLPPVVLHTLQPYSNASPEAVMGLLVQEAASERASFINHLETNQVLSHLHMPEKQKFFLQYLQSNEIKMLVGPTDPRKLEACSIAFFEGLSTSQVEEKAKKLNQQLDALIDQQLQSGTFNSGKVFLNAVKAGYAETVQFLCAHGFSSPAVTQGFRPAVIKGVELAPFVNPAILQENYAPDLFSGMETSPFVYAASTGNLQVVQALCKLMYEHPERKNALFPAGVMKPQVGSRVALMGMAIAQGGNPLILREILNLDAQRWNEMWHLPDLSPGDKDGLKLLITRNFDGGGMSQTPLMYAAEQGDTDMVRAFLDAYAQIKREYDVDLRIDRSDCKGYTAHMYAIESGNEEAARGIAKLLREA